MCQVDVKKVAVRKAIWEVYGKRDFYTQEPLEFRDMEIDHIIPRTSFALFNEFTDFNEKNRLIDDYHINCLHNLVPVSSATNRRKSNKEVQLATVLHYFETTKKNVEKIHRKIAEYKKRYKTEDLLVNFKMEIQDEQDELKREEYLDFLIDEETFFTVEDQVFMKENRFYLKKFGLRVGIVAKLPTLNDVETTCSIHFKTRNVRDCILELSNSTIVGSLFVGLNNHVEYDVRPFVNFEGGGSDKKAVLSLGSSRVLINVEDLKEFCDVVDFYGNLYIERIKDIEQKLKTRDLRLSARRNHYQICEIGELEWLKLIKFAQRHDVDSGNTKWHIFDRNAHMIKVFTNIESEEYSADYHAYFDSEFDKDMPYYPGVVSGRRIVTWGFIPDFESVGEYNIGKRDRWDAITAKDWFFNDFVPKVLGKKLKIKKQSEIEKIFHKSKVEPIKYLMEITANDKKKLFELVEKLQLHYNARPHSRYRLSKENHERLYMAIVASVCRCNRLDIHYCSSKLGFEAKTTVSLVKQLKDKMANVQDETVNGFYIDQHFRSLLTAIEYMDDVLASDCIVEIVDWIKYFAELADIDTLLEKYAIDFIE